MIGHLVLLFHIGWDIISSIDNIGPLDRLLNVEGVRFTSQAIFLDLKCFHTLTYASSFTGMHKPATIGAIPYFPRPELSAPGC
jgi:hypothetical protein